MIQTQERPIAALGAMLRRLSPNALGGIGLASGLAALAAVVLGFPSGLLLGTALVIWILSGWALFFQPNPPLALESKLGAVVILSAAVAAFTVLMGLYLLALGPSWKL
jgi:hypothetical protein